MPRYNLRYTYVYIARNNYKTVSTKTLILNMELYKFKIEKN